MENKPNKEESPIYDTNYAQNRRTRVLDLEGKQPEETRTEPPRLAVGRPVGPVPRSPSSANFSGYNSKAVPTRFPTPVTPEPTLDPYIRRGRPPG